MSEVIKVVIGEAENESTVSEMKAEKAINSNIVITAKVVGGYSLPIGYSWNPTLVDNKKEGTVEVFDENGILAALLQYESDLLHGVCQFFENGVLVKEIPYVNDLANGLGFEYDEFGDNKRCCFYENGEKKSELIEYEEKEGYYDEIDVKTHEVISRCFYSDSFERDGIGYHYKDKKIFKIVMYEEGREAFCFKEFNQGIMIEYDENGKKVYEGEFLDSLENASYIL